MDKQSTLFLVMMVGKYTKINKMQIYGEPTLLLCLACLEGEILLQFSLYR